MGLFSPPIDADVRQCLHVVDQAPSAPKTWPEGCLEIFGVSAIHLAAESD